MRERRLCPVAIFRRRRESGRRARDQVSTATRLRPRSVVVLSNRRARGFDYRVNRYRLEIERNQKVLNDRVAGGVFIVGDGSSIADISARLCLAAPHGYERRREPVRGVSGNQTLLAGTRSVQGVSHAALTSASRMISSAIRPRQSSM